MGIRHEIRMYAGECWRTKRQLPQGTHKLASGIEVTFHESSDLFFNPVNSR